MATTTYPGIHYAADGQRTNSPARRRPDWTMASRTPTPEDGERDRLPNLFEVLSRRTLAPVDLFSFYIYMRDVQRSVDYLDFWWVARAIEDYATVLRLICAWVVAY